MRVMVSDDWHMLAYASASICQPNSRLWLRVVLHERLNFLICILARPSFGCTSGFMHATFDWLLWGILYHLYLLRSAPWVSFFNWLSLPKVFYAMGSLLIHGSVLVFSYWVWGALGAIEHVRLLASNRNLLFSISLLLLWPSPCVHPIPKHTAYKRHIE